VDLGRTFQRFFRDWQQFAWAGFGALLIQLVGAAVGMVLALVGLGPSISNLIRESMSPMRLNPVGYVFPKTAAVTGAFGFIAAIAIVGLVVHGLTNAGLVGSVVAYRRGEGVNLSTFWSYATRYFGRMILIGLIFDVIIIPLSSILLFIPVLGWLVWVVWMPTAAVTLMLYPAYLTIQDDYSVGLAIGTGFRIIRSHIGEALLGAGIFVLFLIAFGLIGWIPVLGWLAVVILGQPLLYYFFSERFETEVRPQL